MLPILSLFFSYLSLLPSVDKICINTKWMYRKVDGSIVVKIEVKSNYLCFCHKWTLTFVSNETLKNSLKYLGLQAWTETVPKKQYGRLWLNGMWE